MINGFFFLRNINGYPKGIDLGTNLRNILRENNKIINFLTFFFIFFIKTVLKLFLFNLLTIVLRTPINITSFLTLQ